MRNNSSGTRPIVIYILVCFVQVFCEYKDQQCQIWTTKYENTMHAVMILIRGH